MGSFKVKRTPNKRMPEFSNPNGNAFVIGNGTSRADFDLKPLMDHGMLVGCNYFYRDMHPHVLVLSDEAITNTVAKVDKEWMRRNHVYSWYPKMGGKIKKVSFPEKTSAGLMAVYESIVSFNCKKIFLIGMDFFGLGSNGKNDNGTINNLYVGEKHYAQDPNQHAPTYRNWQRRFQYVLQKFPDVEFYHVAPLDGRSPELLIGAPNFHQIQWEDLLNHLEHDRTLTDYKSIDESDVDAFNADNPDNIKASIERQFTGQENFIYPDRIDPNEFIKIRLQVQNAYRKNPKTMNGLLTVRIKEFDISVPPILVQGPSGVQLATDEQVVKLYQAEIKERYGKMGIKLEPFRDLKPKGDKPESVIPPPLPPPPPPPPL